MKILLIQLSDDKIAQPVYPIGLAYIAASLTGHDVRMVDQNIFDGPFQKTAEAVREFCPDVVGISIRNVRLYSSRHKSFRYYHEQLGPTIKAVRNVSKDAIIITGGAGFSIWPEKIMESEPEIQFGVFLEGENTFRRLLENLGSPEKVNGVFIRDKNGIRMAGHYSGPDFASMPVPRRDLNDPRLYKGEYAVGIQTKRGCALRCSYCNYPYLSGGTVRKRPAKDVVDEIERLKGEHGMDEFTFVDNVFNVPVTHAEEICGEMIRRGVKARWSAWFNERFMDEGFIDLAIEAGCRRFELSPDGYSNKSLKWLNKNIETRHIIKTYRILRRKPDAEVWYNFMIGIPGQDVLSLARLAFFCLRLKLFLGKRLKGISFNKLCIAPNTELEKIALEDKIISREADLLSPYFYEVGVLRWIKKAKWFRSIVRAASGR